MSVRFERMAIAGVGLIGGSLALAARRAGLVGEVVGYGRSAVNLESALAAGVIDRVVTDAAAVADADLVVLAVPVNSCAPLAAAMRPHARAGTVLTDVASVKERVVADLEQAWAAVGPVVGAHPMAGSDAWGVAAARADLFAGRRCILTPTPRTPAAALARLRALWEGVGARVEVMAPAVHDDIVARISHLPHLLAYALVRAVAEARVEGHSVLDYAAGGFLDTTRIAASRPELWRDITLANAPALAEALREFRAALDALVALVAAGDGAGLEAAFAAAAATRRPLGIGR